MSAFRCYFCNSAVSNDVGHTISVRGTYEFACDSCRRPFETGRANAPDVREALGVGINEFNAFRNEMVRERRALATTVLAALVRDPSLDRDASVAQVVGLAVKLADEVIAQVTAPASGKPSSGPWSQP